ncbi:MAG: inositol monophosphatase, partial [Glaciihabitans sp.]|nr:inositol monophosphatase [Glaciihabitans sp.]
MNAPVLSAAATAAATTLPRTVAHRGDSSRYRENTMAAIRSALARGADTVEIDVRVTADGRVVLLHDATLERLWGDERRIGDVTWAECAMLGGGETRIPLLSDVLHLFVNHPATLLIDMDEVTPAAPAVAVVAAALAESNGDLHVAWCGATDAMRVIRSLDADADLWLAWASATAPTADDLRELRPTVLNLPHLLVGETLVEDAHRLGLLVSCWTVDDADQLSWLASIGVDSITSNRLDLLLAMPAEPIITAESVDAEPSTIELRRALLIARDLGRWAIDYVATRTIGVVRTKVNPADHVTELDTAVEEMVRAVIGAQFPGHGFVGEEFGGEAIPGRPCWYLDPVDGTANLANGMPWTSFSLALAVGRQPLVAVVGDAGSGTVLSAVSGGGAFLDGKPLVIATSTSRTGDPLSGAMVSTELAGHRPWPGMPRFLDLLGDRF